MMAFEGEDLSVRGRQCLIELGNFLAVAGSFGLQFHCECAYDAAGIQLRWFHTVAGVGTAGRRGMLVAQSDNAGSQVRGPVKEVFRDAAGRGDTLKGHRFLGA